MAPFAVVPVDKPYLAAFYFKGCDTAFSYGAAGVENAWDFEAVLEAAGRPLRRPFFCLVCSRRQAQFSILKFSSRLLCVFRCLLKGRRGRVPLFGSSGNPLWRGIQIIGDGYGL